MRAFVFMDVIHYKVREDGVIKNKAAYVVLGADLDGFKDILGIWINWTKRGYLSSDSPFFYINREILDKLITIQTVIDNNNWNKLNINSILFKWEQSYV